MNPAILVLEDDQDRVAVMRGLLTEKIAGHCLVFLDNAPDTIHWLRDHLPEVSLICLDHDLGPNRERNAHLFDPGIGRDVVDYLVTQKPICPVIVHSTNSPAAFGMRADPKDAGWTCARVIPFNDLEWIASEWLSKVKRGLGLHK